MRRNAATLESSLDLPHNTLLSITRLTFVCFKEQTVYLWKTKACQVWVVTLKLLASVGSQMQVKLPRSRHLHQTFFTMIKGESWNCFEVEEGSKKKSKRSHQNQCKRSNDENDAEIIWSHVMQPPFQKLTKGAPFWQFLRFSLSWWRGWGYLVVA